MCTVSRASSSTIFLFHPQGEFQKFSPPFYSIPTFQYPQRIDLDAIFIKICVCEQCRPCITVQKPKKWGICDRFRNVVGGDSSLNFAFSSTVPNFETQPQLQF